MSTSPSVASFIERNVPAPEGEGVPLPIEDIVFMETDYLFGGRGEEYDGERKEFDNYERALFLRMLVQRSDTRTHVRRELLRQRMSALMDRTEPVDDEVLQLVAENPQLKQKLVDLGLSEEEMNGFLMPHAYMDKYWVQDVLRTEPFQGELREIQQSLQAHERTTSHYEPADLDQDSDFAFDSRNPSHIATLAQKGIASATLNLNSRDIFAGAGSLPLMLLSRSKTPIQFDQRALEDLICTTFLNGDNQARTKAKEIVATVARKVGEGEFVYAQRGSQQSIQGVLEMLTYARHYHLSVEGKARYGRMYQESADLMQVLIDAGFPRELTLDEKGEQRTVTRDFLAFVRSGEIPSDPKKRQSYETVLQNYLTQQPAPAVDWRNINWKSFFQGGWQEVLQVAMGKKSWEETWKKIARLPDLETLFDRTQAISPFDELKALEKLEQDMIAMQSNAVSVGGKWSQWWMEVYRARTASEPKKYEQLVRILAEAKVERDLALMAQGNVPVGYNVHHISPLSNFAYREEMLRHRDVFLAQGWSVEDGASLTQRASAQMVRRLMKLGVVGSAKEWKGFMDDSRLLVPPNWQNFVREVQEGTTTLDSAWFEQQANYLKDTLGNLLLSREKHPTVGKNGELIFHANQKQVLTAKGMMQEDYRWLSQQYQARAGSMSKPFDAEIYAQCVQDLCHRMVPKIFAEEMAHQQIARDAKEQGGTLRVIRTVDGVEQEFHIAPFGSNRSGFEFIYNHQNKGVVIDFNPEGCNLCLANSSRTHPKHHPHSAIHALLELQVNNTKAGVWSRGVFLPVPNQVMVTSPVQASFRGIAFTFPRSFSEVDLHRATCLMPYWFEVRKHLPQGARFGPFQRDEIEDPRKLQALVKQYRKDPDFATGLEAGETEARVALGEIHWKTQRPVLPETASRALWVGIYAGVQEVLRNNPHAQLVYPIDTQEPEPELSPTRYAEIGIAKAFLLTPMRAVQALRGRAMHLARGLREQVDERNRHE